MNKALVRIEDQIAHLDITGAFAADDLEALIHKLAHERQALRPAVEADFTKVAATQARSLDHVDPSVIAAAQEGGRVGIYARSSGLGWVGFSLSQEVAHALGRELVRLGSAPGDHDKAVAVGKA